MHIIEVEKNVPNGHAKKCKVDGILYPSIAQACNYLGINDQTVQTYRNKFKMSTEEAMNYACEKLENSRRRQRSRYIQRQEELKKQEEISKASVFFFNGQEYENFRTAVEDISWENEILLNPDSIKARAKINKCSLQEQLSATLRKHLARKERDKRDGGWYFNSENDKLELYRRIYKRWNWSKEKEQIKGNPTMSKHDEIYQRYLDGETNFEKLGREYGVTRERIRQVIEKKLDEQNPIREPLSQINKCRRYLEDAAKGLIGYIDNDTFAEYNNLVRDFDSFVSKLEALSNGN